MFGKNRQAFGNAQLVRFMPSADKFAKRTIYRSIFNAILSTSHSVSLFSKSNGVLEFP